MKIRFGGWLAMWMLLGSVVEAQTPVDATDRDLVPTVFAEAGGDGSLDVAWRASDGRILLSTFSGPNFSTGKQVQLATPMQLLGGLARDEAGNRYIAVFRRERATVNDWAAGFRPGVAHVLKVAPGSDRTTLLADLNQARFIANQRPIVNPLEMENGAVINSEMVYANGTLIVGFGHNNGQASDVHNTGALIGIKVDGSPAYNGGGEQHTGHIRLAVDGGNFLKAQTFDQGLALSTLKRSSGDYTWSNFVLLHEANHVEEHVYIGGVVPTPSHFLLIFSTGRGALWNRKNDEIGILGDCAIKLRRVARNFDTLPKFDWWPGQTDPSKLYLRRAQGGFPIVTIASPAPEKSYLRPIVASLPDGRSIVAYEQWGRPEVPAEGVRASLLGVNGNVLRQSELFAGLKIQKSTRAIYLPTLERIGWVNGDVEKGRLILHTLNADLQLESFELGRGGGGAAPVNPTGRLNVASIPGRYVRDNPENDYHDGKIEAIATAAGQPPAFRWTNKAGVSWRLTANLATRELATSDDNPYFATDPVNGRSFKLIQRTRPNGTPLPSVDGFMFLNEFYRRQD